MIDSRKYDKLKETMINILNLESGSKEELDAVNAWERSSHKNFYTSLTEGFIYESDMIFKTLEFYIEDNDEERVSTLVSILDTYYTGYLKGKFDECVENEEYEMCDKLSKVCKF